MSKKVIIPVNRLESFCSKVLLKTGLCERHAVILTDTLVCAELRGVSSHGLARLSTYLERITAGVMAVNPEMPVEKETPGAALLNANNGFGQLAGVTAMELALHKAKVNGAAVVAVKNSNHFGIAAYYAMMALKEDMVGLVITNASPAINPHNTKTPLMGTNPLAVAVPAMLEKPIVLDMSTSVVARGKIRRASIVGDKIPFGWAVDADGKPTDDPQAALKGSLEPIGGPKGAGLSLVIDLLCGALTGAALTGEVKNLLDTSGPARTGHMFMAINVETFINANIFKQSVDSVIAKIKALPSADGGPVYLPGEIEFNLAEKRRTEGIPLTQDIMEEFAKLAQRYGIDPV